VKNKHNIVDEAKLCSRTLVELGGMAQEKCVLECVGIRITRQLISYLLHLGASNKHISLKNSRSTYINLSSQIKVEPRKI
jgi:hypothetical protein